jgi:hypothetical protein
LAESWGGDRSAISKKFDGRQNMTLETLADLAYALDRPVKVTLPERVPASAGSNQPGTAPGGDKPLAISVSVTTASGTAPAPRMLSLGELKQ